ncbi:unnamed protein product, partial [Rotaria socialis]
QPVPVLLQAPAALVLLLQLPQPVPVLLQAPPALALLLQLPQPVPVLLQAPAALVLLLQLPQPVPVLLQVLQQVQVSLQRKGLVLGNIIDETTTSTTTTRCPDICWVENCETGNRTTIPCPNTTCATTIVPTITTTTTVASLQSDCSTLQAELTRVKLGLGIGLGSGMAITSGLAAGSYIYFTRRLAQLSTAEFAGARELTTF